MGKRWRKATGAFSRRAAFLLSLMVLPVTSHSASQEQLTELYVEATHAVSEGNFERFRALLEANPSLVNHQYPEGCPLLCEFSFFTPGDGVDDATPDVAEPAIEMLLNLGANPTLSPDLVTNLLAETHGFPEDYNLYSGLCSPSRDAIFPLLNRLIANEANLGEIAGLPYSGAFYYVFDLCYAPVLCGASYEKIDREVLKVIGENISDNEEAELRRWSQGDALVSRCVSQIFRY